jgi:SET domain-containing protein
MFIIKQSLIPNAGLGLFTLQDIKKGQVISAYYGEKITYSELSKRFNDGKGRYAVAINSRYCIDAENSSCPARFANDAKGSKFKNNCQFVTNKGAVALYSTKNIKQGEELLVRYGSSYWNAFKV